MEREDIEREYQKLVHQFGRVKLRLFAWCGASFILGFALGAWMW